jgi:hypothetical protein
VLFAATCLARVEKQQETSSGDNRCRMRNYGVMFRVLSKRHQETHRHRGSVSICREHPQLYSWPSTSLVVRRRPSVAGVLSGTASCQAPAYSGTALRCLAAIVLWRRGSSSMLRELQHGRRWRVPMHSDEETRELRDDMRFFLQARRFYLCAHVVCIIPKHISVK